MARSDEPVGTLQLRELFISSNAFVFFVCAFDAVFELAPVVQIA
jgi:hypothetical protein